MKHSAEKKQAIVLYILEKIQAGTQGLSRAAAEAFQISTNTVHAYLNQLIENGVIEKQKRDTYRLVNTLHRYTFKRSAGELKNDTLAYDKYLEEKIRPFSQNVQRIWAYGLSEMVNNVIDHSNAETMEMTIVQNYLTTAVLLNDDGVGIFQKIKDHFDLPSLDEAICELFKGKLTTDEKNHSGEGIFFTSKMMDGFWIRSGSKKFTTSKYGTDSVSSVPENATGTSVFMCLSNFTHKTPKEIFDQYSDVDGGFTTTRIPLKNIFDTVPVSRSQAKRVCNRLESFQEVILDFEGIEWMGQGFAHQIFSVFQNAHPQIALVVQNMNDSVKSMYDHVLKS